MVALAGRARQALAQWGLGGQEPDLLKFRENAVFRVRLATGEPAALRLHRPGYHDRTALQSELDWTAVLLKGGLSVPRPIATPDGRLIVDLAASIATRSSPPRAAGSPSRGRSSPSGCALLRIAASTTA